MTDDRPASIVVLPRQPRLDQLVVVLPVAQTQKHVGVELLALAVEVYTAGWVITFPAPSHGAVPFINATPALTLAVADDHGNPYHSHAYGGTGEGAGNDWQWRLTYRGIAALDPQAHTLHLVTSMLTWSQSDVATQRFVLVRTVAVCRCTPRIRHPCQIIAIRSGGAGITRARGRAKGRVAPRHVHRWVSWGCGRAVGRGARHVRRFACPPCRGCAPGPPTPLRIACGVSAAGSGRDTPRRMERTPLADDETEPAHTLRQSAVE